MIAWSDLRRSTRHRSMRIDGSRIDEFVADRFGTNKSRANNSRQVPEFVETVGLPTVVCGPDLPEFMEDG